MAEPSIVELYIKIEKLEKELQTAQQYVVHFREAQYMLEQKDKEIAALLNEKTATDKQIPQFQQVISNQKIALDDQNSTIQNLVKELDLVKKEKNSLQESLNIASQQRDIAIERTRVIPTMENTIKQLQGKFARLQQTCSKIVNYFRTCNQYNTEFSEELNRVINL